jgi:hypothetical protein
MSKTDYLPSNTFEFQNLVHDVRKQAGDNQTAWDISSTALTELDAPIAAFDAAVLISENPETRTSAAIAKRDRMRRSLEDFLRPFIQGQLINNRRVPAEALKAMGLPVHDHHPTPAPDPVEVPELDATPESSGIVKVRFRRVAGHGKPPGVKTLEICMVVTDSPNPPEDWSALHESVLATRSPLRIVRSGHERGKWLHLAGRWVNTRGVKGPWSSIISGLIP